MYAHQTVPDLTAFSQDATANVQAQGYDAYCDGATVIQGALTDTMQPSVWIAETQPVSGQTGSLLIGAIIIAILAVIYKLWPVWLVLALIYGATVIKNAYFKDPTYNLPPESGINEPVPWTDAVTWYNNHYWYVCAKDLYAVGAKSQYASPSDVPQDQINIFNDHCTNAPDISPQVTSWIQWVIYAAVAIGVVYVVIKVVPYFLTKPKG